MAPRQSESKKKTDPIAQKMLLGTAAGMVLNMVAVVFLAENKPLQYTVMVLGIGVILGSIVWGTLAKRKGQDKMN